jgi:hypothetical protein
LTKKILPQKKLHFKEIFMGVEIFFAKPGGCSLARAEAAYLCIRFY